MARKPYTVENQRPRRTVQLPGVLLAPKGRGRTSRADLTLSDVLGSPCLRLLASGRLRVVRGEQTPVLDALAALAAADSGEEVVLVPTPAPAEVVIEEKPEPVPELPPVLDTPSSDEDGEDEGEPLEEVDSAPSEEEVAEELSAPTWTAESLKALNSAEQKDICRDLGIKVSGKEDARISRILEALEGGN